MSAAKARRADEERRKRAMLKIVIALVLLAHGIGHSMGLVQLFKVATVHWLPTDLAA
jgi:hypothetical protein